MKKYFKAKIPQQLYTPMKFFLLGFCFVALSVVLGINILAAFSLLALVLYANFSPIFSKKLKRENLLLLMFLFVVFLFISVKIIEYGAGAAYIPVCGFVMLVSVIFGSLEIMLIASVAAAVFTGLIAGNSLFYSLIFLVSGIISGLCVWQLRRRIQLFNAGLYVGFIQLLLYKVVFAYSFKEALPNLYSGIINGVIATGMLPLVENVFNVTTNFSLLELSDFNHPLLKRLILEAPGTYHHSLLVGNLSEAASEAVGANSLLARIGAYYHDVGKLHNAGYFMENQRESSKHLKLSPTMSKMVIINHVKEGVELARKFRLKPAIIDFINMHHGKGLVFYFYRKALEENGEQGGLQEEGFRYHGPKPNSKETAIVLLADSVEAASRVLDEPNPEKIKEIVYKIINNKFTDGQLDDCDLTLKDLEKIAGVFSHMLGGIYHGRVKYPDGQDSSNPHKKHNHNNSAGQPKNHKENHPRNP